MFAVTCVPGCYHQHALRKSSIKPDNSSRLNICKHELQLEGLKQAITLNRHQPRCTPGTHVRDGGEVYSTQPPKAPRMNRLLQNINTAGTSLFFQIIWNDQRLAIPHISVPDIRWIKWEALKAAGFKGCVFDKDNTLCEPFALEVHPKLQQSLADCRDVFDGRMVLFSNSAGLLQYDPQGEEAAALEAVFGIPVLRHTQKKPAGGCEELEQHFGCPASEIVFIGDRYLTDIVYGNRHGMLTIRCAPLTQQGEPAGVQLARPIEDWYVGRWMAQGIKAPAHPLIGHNAMCGMLRDAV
eukprot:jgi/Chrzof1/2988/Cz12g07050.t1